MSRIKYWSIEHFDTGTSLWVRDTSIPRAGLNSLTRTNQANINFMTLADGSLSLMSSEHKANWQTITLTFPKQVITDTVRTQLSDYIDNNQGVRITVPINSGANLYSEKKLEGYLLKYNEQWIPGDTTQKYIVEITMQEFDVDADGSLV